jgi:uncharacterized protein YjcR
LRRFQYEIKAKNRHHWPVPLERGVNELAADYGVHPVQITQWKRVALEALPDIFSSRRGAKHKDEETLKAALYQQIGQLKVELDWLKKKVGLVR